MKKYLSFLLVSFFFAGFAQAYEVSKTAGWEIKTGYSESRFRVTGEIKTTTTDHRKVHEFDSGELTVGDVNKYKVVEVDVKQHGVTYGTSGSASVYASVEFGNIEAGGSATIGSESSHGDAYDNSTISENGTNVVDLKTYKFVGWFPVQVGSFREVETTDTQVQLANSSHTDSYGGYVSKTRYIK